MGSIIGGLIGGVGQLFGASKQAKAAERAGELSMTGYNYLTSGAGAAPTRAYVNAGQSALQGQGTTQNALAQLLGIAPTSALYGGEGGATGPDAFQSYRDSTGYNFQLDQGMNALNSNAAAKGLLNSGGTAKALTQYGQNLASTTFNNYLTQLAGLNSAQGGTAQMGQNALGQVAQVGTGSGANAANAAMAGGGAQAAGIVGASNAAGNILGNAFNTIGGFNPRGGGLY